MSASLERKRAPLLWFPLLAKELTEKANRLRTYWIRTAYVLVFFSYFGFEGYALLKNASTGLSGLGTGALFFEKIYRFQLFGTLLFLPALMSGLITFEKERDSLPLLLTTDLEPWRIIIQKYIGGIMPMLALQLTALPMTAVSYSLGGVENRDIWMGAALIIAHTLHMGAFYLACSAYCRSSVGAFLMAYLVGAIVFGLLIPMTSARDVLGFPLPPYPETLMHQTLLIRVLPVFTIAWLLLSTRWLRTRAEISRKNQLRALFLKIDRVFHAINDKLGGVNIAKAAHGLPDSKPVKWRELHQRALAQPHYLIRIGLVVEAITVVAIVWACFEASSWNISKVDELSQLFFALWALYALVLIVQGANIIASERTQQTLEVLMTTPMTGSSIIKQKSVIFGRIAVMAVIPLGTVCWTEAHMEQLRIFDAFSYGATSLITFIIVSGFIFWLAVAVGLHVRSRFKALLTAIIILLALVALPYIDSDNFLLVAMNPATAIIENESGQTQSAFLHASALEVIAINLLTLTALALILRYYCLRSADQLLGRASR